jgi:glutathione synthase/RimK-type ligase-like ATP-grasp enzyme
VSVPRLVILTPDAAEPSWSAVGAPEFFRRLAAPLEAAGLTVAGAPWTGESPQADAYCPLMAWGYHKRWSDWLARLDQLAGARVINPVPTLRWNGDKIYLTEMAERGAPLPPTLALDRPDAESVERACLALNADEVVVKPRVSGGSFQTVRVRRGEPLHGGPESPALVQPFLPAVAAEGEWSLFFFGSAFSHGLTKVAAEGDFRVQPQFGGRVEGRSPPQAAMTAAEAVLAACPHPWTYARVDLIADGDGGYVLMELELIEPHLFLDQAPDGGAAFGAAMRAAVEA